MEQATRVHGDAKTRAKGGRQGLVRASHGELELTAMAGAHGVVAHSHTDAMVAIKWAMALASRPISMMDQSGGRSEEQWWWLATGELEARWRVVAMVATAMQIVASPRLEQLQW